VTIDPSGRVVANNMSAMGTICGNMWDDVDADVVCRQMGYSSGVARLIPRDYVYNRLLYNVRCMGHESQLGDCQTDAYDMMGTCYYAEDAGVTCNNGSSGKWGMKTF
jgi:deleted-in-malignant-brain-tumors protein 1